MQRDGQWKNMRREKFGAAISGWEMIYGKRMIGGTDLGKPTPRGIIWKVAVSTMRKWKCLLAKDCEQYSTRRFFQINNLIHNSFIL